MTDLNPIRGELLAASRDKARDAVRISALLYANAWVWAALSVCWLSGWSGGLYAWPWMAIAAAVFAVAGWRTVAAWRLLFNDERADRRIQRRALRLFGRR